MATAAERQRRSRAHRKGNHEWCDPGCDAVTPAVTRDKRPAVTPVIAPTPAPVAREELPDGGIEGEVQEFVDALQFADGDPRRILCRIAVRLARRVDESGALPAAIRELRVLLMQIAEVPDQLAGPLDGVRAQRAARRVDGLLRKVV